MQLAPARPTLRLPVEGRALVVHGGRDIEHNHHLHPDAPSQRHAYDLIGVDEGGRMYLDDGAQLDEWVGWGMPVVAAGDGVVTEVRDGAADTPIGAAPELGVHPGGNHVVVRHDDGSYTAYAHLQRGSVREHLPGSRVTAGTILGLLGNSGNSSAPHLHVQRQIGSPEMLDGSATGVELAWSGARLLGRFDFHPERGFERWAPAAGQPAEPHVGRRGEVLEHG